MGIIHKQAIDVIHTDIHIEADYVNDIYFFYLHMHGWPSHSLILCVFERCRKSYAISMASVFYGDARVHMDSNVIRTVIFDSGTSYSYLVSSLYNAIVATVS